MDIYISLPITGQPYDEVVRRCNIAKERYERNGDRVITPIDINTLDTPYNVCIGKCVECLMNCQKAVFLNGFRNSKGCRTELAICLIFDIDIVIDNTIE